MVNRKSRQSLLLVVIVIVVYLISCCVGNLLGQTFSSIIWGQQFTDETPYINSLIASVLFGTIVGMILWRLDLWDWKKCEISQILTTSIILLVGEVLCASIFISSLVSSFGFENQLATENVWKNAGEHVNIALQIICIVIFTPVAEEIVFRGAIFRVIREKHNFFFAATISSILFGLIHGLGIYTISTFIMGMFFCLAFEKTKSLLTCVMIHVINNLIGVLPIGQSESTGAADQSAAGLLLGVIALIISLAIFIKEYKKCKGTKEISASGVSGK